VEQGAAERPGLKRQAPLGFAGALPWRRRVIGPGEIGPALRRVLEAELAQRAGFQWLAVCFGAGCLAYFALPREPLLAALLPASLTAALWAGLAYRRGGAWRIAVVIAFVLAGATAAKLRVERLAGPQIGRAFSTAVTGRVAAVEDRVERRPRLILERLQADPQPAAMPELPERIRVSFGERAGLPPLGARITFRARLMPVGGAVVPGGYDPHRAAFFEGIGGSGFMLGGWQQAEPPPAFAWDLAVARLRAAMVARIRAAEPGEAGALAAALLVGDRSGLSERTNESLRLSGLAHILSISGLHMMLVAGTAFFVVRALLALSPALALARPIRKWAAAAALLVVTLYLLISGGGAATERAYVMAAVLFVAMLADRQALSMRNLAVAALIVLAREPESVTEPGFQMSFAAVAALMAGWEAWAERQRLNLSDDPLPGGRLIRIVGRAVAGVAITTLLAGLATAPFAAYHFERVATYSLLGNLLAAPLVSFIIMPFGMLGLVLMPFGLEGPPLHVMALGSDLLFLVSDRVAALPGSEVRAPAMAALSLALIAAGLLWLCLWRLRWRLLGVPAVALGLALAPLLTDPADVLVAPDGRVVAVRDASGALRVSGSRSGSYVVEQLFDEEADAAPSADALRQGVRCDASACRLVAADGRSVAHVLDPAAFPEDCRRADIVVTPLDAPADCRAALVIDAQRLQRFGAHAVRLEQGVGTSVATARSETPRPWE
jgi:competence protein ComEC